VFDLVLRVEERTVVKLVADAKYRAREIKFGEAGIAARVRVIDLAVTPQA